MARRRLTPRDWGLVLGGAETLWDDLSRLEEIVGEPWPGVVLATNEAGVDYPRDVHHWVTYHPEKFERVCPPGKDSGAWESRRAEAGRNTDYVTWSTRAGHIVDRVTQFKNVGGSSGHLALRVGLLALNLKRMVLAGVPMERRPHYHDANEGDPWSAARNHWPWEKRLMKEYEPRVRSMSGNTRSRFGEPTPAWLKGEAP